MSNPSRNQYDVIIAGAGLAGCSAAAFLSQRGLSVLLLDKETFPRDKVCGDGISGPALTMLRRIGVLDKIRQQNPWKIQRVVVSSPSGTTIKVKSPYIDKDIDSGYVLPREKLDHLLFDYVKDLPHVEAFENTAIKDLVMEGKKASGIIATTGSETEEYRAKYIIGADGAHSPIAKKLSLFNDNPKHRAFAIRAYFENTRDMEDAIEIHYDPATIPGYGWIFPTGKNSANIGVIVFNRFKDSKGIEKLFETFISSNPHALEKLKNARMIEDTLKGWPLTYGPFPSKRTWGNVLLAGDAASMIDPLTGEGIFYALKSGEFAAEAIGNAVLNSLPHPYAAGQYERLWKKAFKWKEYMPGYLFQTFFNKRWILDLSIKRASKNKKTAATLAGVIGHNLPKSKLFFNF
jgi:geranylgeranyl reductase family protein